MVRTLVLLGWCLVSFATSPIAAQQPDNNWSSPVRIAETIGNLATTSYALLSDQTGGIHIFYRHEDETQVTSIDYLCWKEGVWSEPVDIVSASADENIYAVHAIIDDYGTVHLTWVSNSGIEYATAAFAQAGNVRTWTPPAILANAFGDFDIRWSDQGILYLGYVDNTTKAILLMHSEDRGITWSNSVLVATSSHPSVMPNQVRLAIDADGRLHLVWTEYELPNGWPPTGVYYARSEDGGENWTIPLQIDDSYHAEIGVGVVGENEVHLVWRSTIGGDGTFHQWSADGGQTWSQIDQVTDRGGLSGLPSFAVDSLGIVHWVIGPVKYAYWEQGRVSEYVDVATEQRQISQRSVERGAIAITSGNRLHIIFELDFQSLWHTSRVLSAPESDPVPYLDLPTPAPTSTPVIAEIAQPIPNATINPQWQTEATTPPTIFNFGLISAFLLPLLLVTGMVFIHFNRKQR